MPKTGERKTPGRNNLNTAYAFVALIESSSKCPNTAWTSMQVPQPIMEKGSKPTHSMSKRRTKNMTPDVDCTVEVLYI